MEVVAPVSILYKTDANVFMKYIFGVLGVVVTVVLVMTNVVSAQGTMTCSLIIGDQWEGRKQVYAGQSYKIDWWTTGADKIRLVSDAGYRQTNLADSGRVRIYTNSDDEGIIQYTLHLTDSYGNIKRCKKQVEILQDDRVAAQTEKFTIVGAGQSNIARYFTEYDGEAAAYLEDMVESKLGLESGTANFVNQAVGSTALLEANANINATHCAYWTAGSAGSFRDGPCLTAAIDGIKSLVASGENIDLILWAQGERDSRFIDNVSERSEYQNGLEYTFRRLRSAAGDPDLKIGIQALGLDQQNINQYGWNAVLGVQNELSNIDGNNVAILARTKNLPMEDRYHLTLEGYKTAAERIAANLDLWLNGDLVGGGSGTSLVTDGVIRLLPTLFSSPSQRVAIPTFTKRYDFERAISNPYLTHLIVPNRAGTNRKYVYLTMRVARGDDEPILRMARILASDFSEGDSIATLSHDSDSKWEWIPVNKFGIEPPPGKSGVLGNSLTSVDGMLLVTYRTKLQEDVDSRMVLFDPVEERIVWDRSIAAFGSEPGIRGYEGPDKIGSITRVTSAPVDRSTSYFDSNQGRVMVSYQCRGDGSSACVASDGSVRTGYFVQELVLNRSLVPSFRPSVKIFNDEITDENVRQWRNLGNSVWRKQNFDLHNGGSDTMLFSVNYSRVDDTDRSAARDFPRYTSFFKVENISELLDRARSGEYVDISDQMPASSVWTNGVTAGNYSSSGGANTNNSPWDQGATWHNTMYVDPFNGNKIFTLYESWGAEYMQLPQTQNALYGGSATIILDSLGRKGNQSCNQLCGGTAAFGGGARKEYCLSASVMDKSSVLHGSEIPHDVPLNSIKDPNSGKSVAGAYLSCSDIGSHTTEAQENLFTEKYAIRSAEVGMEAGSLVESLCQVQDAAGYIWIDIFNNRTQRRHYSVDADTSLRRGDVITYACSNDHETSKFQKIITETIGEGGGNLTCDMACTELGVGDGTGYRPYRSKIIGAGLALTRVTVDPLLSLYLYKERKEESNTVWTRMRDGETVSDGFKLECTCGPGRNMRAHMSARVADAPAAQVLGISTSQVSKDSLLASAIVAIKTLTRSLQEFFGL